MASTSALTDLLSGLAKNQRWESFVIIPVSRQTMLRDQLDLIQVPFFSFIPLGCATTFDEMKANVRSEGEFAAVDYRYTRCTFGLFLRDDRREGLALV